MTRFRWGVVTDVGRTRSSNQDSAYAADGFFAVADGMGGHRGGEVASAVAIESLAAALPVVGTDDVLAAVNAANRAVIERAARDASLRGMGTTLCVLALVAPEADGTEPVLLLVNVGDSRAYQFAGGVLEQMTDDHSVVGEMVRQGRLHASEAEAHPQRNILTRAIGIDDATPIDAWHVRPVPGDRWLLCSDGLFNEVTDQTIADVLGSIDDPTAAAEHLVQLANDGGGRDNITVLVADVLDDDAHAAPSTLTETVEAGGLVRSRRRVASPPAAAVPDSPDGGGAGRSDIAGLGVDDRDRDVTGPGAAAGVVDVAEPDPLGVGGRLRAAWRVVAFLVAVIAVIVVAAGAWLLLRDDTTVDTPPAPGIVTTVAPSTTTGGPGSSTTVVAASTSSAAPTSTASG